MEGYVGIKDASQALGIKVRTVREWIHSGRLKAIKYPDCNRWFIAKSEIERMHTGDGNKD